ncbi:MAG: hypothetical protein GYB58_15210 [Gammaproteobacteria bacterium]|jgi:hypothetical protein|uniref:Uncharacterized protein n=1 Tax=Alteromonas oceani TaxID=2071609 RepID=A0ABV7JQV1_9ALTE|nr:hypothetical protein [Alteromonas oceani]MBR9793089.1 hypothetical protein [Gammaproteobacteria bacterium]|tara:strand:- start:5647 stop:5892 length:246 start_codon:yes stop_codon:yes gene_type:complete
MTDQKLILLLKIIMSIGISLILAGVYCHMYSETIEQMGVTGIVISACLVAIGMILSLPTKMYLTFILVKREEDRKVLNQVK